MLYPLKFKDIFKEKVWGGNKLSSVFSKDYAPLPDCGEAWILSGLPGNESEVVNGFLAGNTLADLAEIYMDELLGETTYEEFGEEFPLLFKFIDANDYLSVQVHPDDELAGKMGLKRGKTELWYVVQADPGAQLISGFNQEMNEQLYLDYLNAGKIKEILNYVEVKAGDVLYMPAGRVHALGPGILIAEIQQAADITYRIYDWDRPDKDGNLRELHTDEALQAINFEYVAEVKTAYKPILDNTSSLLSNEHFVCGILHLSQDMVKDFVYMDSFVVYVCIGGRANIEWSAGSLEVKAGEAVLIPAVMEGLVIRPHPSASFLEVLPS